MSKKIITSGIFVLATILLLSIEFSVHSETESISEKVLIEDTEVTQETCEKSIQISAFNDAKAFSDPVHEGGEESACSDVACLMDSPCLVTDSCSHRIVCDGCNCKMKEIGSLVGPSRCGGD